MKTYFRIISFVKPFSRFAIPYAVFAFLAIFFGLMNYTFLMPVLDILFGSVNTSNATQLPQFSFDINYLKGTFDYYIIKIIQLSGKEAALIFVCLFLLAANLFTNIFKYLSLRVISKARAVIIKNIRLRLFNKITDLHIGYFSNERKGDLVSRLTNDVQQIEHTVIDSLTIFFRDPLTIIVYFTLLFMISWKLMLYTLIILPTSGTIISLISKRLKKDSLGGQVKLGNILTIIDETISGLRVVKAFNAEKYQLRKFEKENGDYAGLVKSMSNKRELSSPLSEFLGVSVVAVILWIGGNMVFNGELAASAFFLFIISFYNILVPVKAISASVTNLQRAIASGDRIFKVLDTESEIKESASPKIIQNFQEGIEYKNVHFAYEDKKVLNGINLSIQKGKMIALVGPSGGGKSTLADLIPRFYDPIEGDILLDGVNIKDYSLVSLRSQMGIVTQESILFNDTIYNNIAFGKPEATEEEVIAAAKIANAHDFIIQTSNGYQTEIGDRGTKLSGGQRQRISIARAVLKNPPILILDEATSALDAESEKLVQEALNSLMKNRTSIVIAHRLSTIQHADEIVVIHQGEIIERGTHAELLSKDGTYKKLNISSFEKSF